MNRNGKAEQYQQSFPQRTAVPLPAKGRIWTLTIEPPILTRSDILQRLKQSKQSDGPVVNEELVEVQRQAVEDVVTFKGAWMWLSRLDLLDYQVLLPAVKNDPDLPGAVLYGLTAGALVDQHSRREACLDIMAGFLFDFISNLYLFAAAETCRVAIEEVIKPAQVSLGKGIFPGDGEIPLTAQHTLGRLLDTERRIGLTVTRDAGALQPQKSLLAIAPMLPMEQKRTVEAKAISIGQGSSATEECEIMNNHDTNCSASNKGRQCDCCSRAETCLYRK
ncbi:MAG: hypothetical protein ACOYCB_06810 [Fastidiosipilaceae bacterium]|nr:hypothetical protein [Clostridiaceae bacterium]